MTADVDLGRSRIFDGLNAAERQAWLEAADRQDLVAGRVLVRQGDSAGRFFLVAAGLLKLVQSTADGHDIIVRIVAPGEPFGGVVALDGVAYPVTAIAAGPTQVIGWPRVTLAQLLAAHPQVRTNIMREMADHMTEAMTRVRELSTERVGQRVARALVRLARQCGQPSPGGVRIEYPFTRQELAELSGTTLYTASRAIARWQADGVLGSTGRRVVVLEPGKLEALARGR